MDTVKGVPIFRFSFRIHILAIPLKVEKKKARDDWYSENH